MKHYLYLKNDDNDFLILFFSYISSEDPFWGANALSKYYLDEIGCPYGVSSCNEKSRTTQKKDGK